MCRKIWMCVVTIVLFAVQFSIQDVQAQAMKKDISKGTEYKLIWEKEFDKEIEEVVFDSYTEKGHTKFYPKVVVLKKLDRLDKEERTLYRKGVRILDLSGKIVAKISDLSHHSKIRISRKGNFIGVLRREYEQPLRYPLPETRIVENRFTVYNDKGETVWEKDLNKPPYIYYEAIYGFDISPRDGSVLCGPAGGWSLYDSLGNPAKLTHLNQYEELRFSFSSNWKYIVVGAQKYPLYRYQKLPDKSSEPSVMLLDSLFNIVWEHPIDEYLIDWVIISPSGAYIGVGAHTMLGTGKKEERIKGEKVGGMASSSGILYDRKGNFLMKIPWGGWMVPRVFSSNERYLVASGRNYATLIDLQAKKELFKKEFSDRVIKASVSDSGESVVVTQERTCGKIYFINKMGEIIYESEVLEGVGRGPEAKVALHTLGWDGSNSVIGKVERKSKRVKILSNGKEIR